MKPESDDPEMLGIGAPTETRYDDLPMFQRTHARGTDPQTSHDAGASMKATAAQQARHLYDALVAFGPLTCDEADQKLNWRPTTAGRRISDLVRDGLAAATDKTRPTRQHREATVYRAIAKREAA